MSASQSVDQALRDQSAVEKLLPANVSVDSLLAVGGQGVVYQGHVDQSPAAIKLYFPGQLEKRIEREIRALGRIKSDSIVKLLLTDELDLLGRKVQLVATEFIEGEPLVGKISNGPLTEHETMQIVFNVAIAIDALWQQRIVHRDLKPNNIMVRPDGTACVIDLGVARHIDESDLTQLNQTWGTLGYMSPEQRKCVRKLSCKSDIYALGVISIECGTGSHPTNGDQNSLVASDLHQDLPDPLSSWSSAPLLSRMISPRRTARPTPGQILSNLSN